MEWIKIIGKKVLLVALIGLAILMVGLAGQLDHDEYIEANSKPVMRIIN